MESRQVQQFKRGAIEMAVLSIISSGETYGYEIVKKLHNGFNGIFSGEQRMVIYPILRRLENGGFVKSREKIVRGRETYFYSITDSGVKELSAQKMFWKEFVLGINSFIG